MEHYLPFLCLPDQHWLSHDKLEIGALGIKAGKQALLCKSTFSGETCLRVEEGHLSPSADRWWQQVCGYIRQRRSAVCQPRGNFGTLVLCVQT